MLRLGSLLGALLIAPLGMPSALAQGQPDTAPILRIETGMHGAVINRLAVDEAAERIVTVSDDKTTRLWSLADGSQQQVFRTQIGGGDTGSLYAVAMNGDNLVVGGWAGSNSGAIYVFSLKTGAMRGSIGGFKGAVTSLAFSQDGKALAVADEGVSLTLIDFVGMKPKATDKSYGSKISWIAFAPDGSLATSSEDGEIRVLDQDLKELARTKLDGGDKPWGLAFSPDGTQLAVGDHDKTVVSIFTTQGLTPAKTLQGGPNTAGDLAVVAWSANGKELVAAGRYRGADGRRLIRFWQVASGSFTPTDKPAARDTITDLAVLSTGEVVYASAEPSFGIINSAGAERLHHASHHPDFRDAGNAFKVSSDGGLVEFPTAQGGKGRFRYDLLQSALTKDPGTAGDVASSLVQDATLAPNAPLNGTTATVGGQPVALEPNEHVRSLAIIAAPKTRSLKIVSASGRVVLGTDFYIRAAGVGPDKGWKTVVPAPAFMINATSNGRYVLAGLGDGTIRWYDTVDGHEVMSLFVDTEDQRWVVWLPEGFFDHSPGDSGPGGETLVGYQINHGANKLADFVEIGQLYDKFHRRDMVVARFRGDEAQETYVEQQATRTGDPQTALNKGLPPSVKLIDFCIVPTGTKGCPEGTGKAPVIGDQRHFDVTGTGDQLFARYSLTNRGGGLEKVVIRRDAATIDSTRTMESDDGKQRVETVTLPLKAGKSTISFTSVSTTSSIESPSGDAITLTVTPNLPVLQTPAAAPGATLYAVIVGVDKYKPPFPALENAANDARAVYDLLNKPAPPVYSRPDVKLLLNDDATIPNIMAALQHIADKSKPDDIAIVFFSGHGKAVDGKYYFAPPDFATKHPDLVNEAEHSDSARQEEIIDQLFRLEGLGGTVMDPVFAKMQGDTLIVLDTCYSGSLATQDAVALQSHNDTATDELNHDTGRFLIAGARAEAADAASAAPDHGLFTYWFLQGLDGKADLAHEGKVSVVELLKYTQRTVKTEAQKQHMVQVPKYQLGGNDDFDIRGVVTQ